MKSFNKLKPLTSNSTSNNSNINRNCSCATRYARGTVWWVNMQDDPMCPNMQKGERPVLIYSNNVVNNRGCLVEVIPLSSNESNEPFVDKNCIKFNYDGDSYILANMIRLINCSHFKSYYFTVTDEVMEKVEHIRMKTDGTYDKYIKPNMEVTKDITTANTAKVDTINDIKTYIENIANNAFTNDVIKQSYENSIAELKTEISSITQSYNSILDKLNQVESENALLTKINAGLSEQCNMLHNKTTSKSTMPATITISNVKTTTYHTKRRNNLPTGFWKELDNNIVFWNDYVTNGYSYCLEKYNYPDKAALDKRKSNVKQFLIKHGYTVDKNTTITKKG